MAAFCDQARFCEKNGARWNVAACRLAEGLVSMSHRAKSVPELCLTDWTGQLVTHDDTEITVDADPAFTEHATTSVTLGRRFRGWLGGLLAYILPSPPATRSPTTRIARVGMILSGQLTDPRCSWRTRIHPSPHPPRESLWWGSFGFRQKRVRSHDQEHRDSVPPTRLPPRNL